MNKIGHGIYLGTMSAITLAATVYLFYVGWDFYSLPLEERFYHPRYDWYKASGILGHGLGIVGTVMILFGVVMYITAKKYGYLDRYIRLKYLLEFHIFLCTLGPILVLFHTTFKFGGIVSVAFWSMVVVVLSGVVGRYLYLQIPRSISGRALSVQEVQAEHSALLGQMSDSNEAVSARELKASVEGAEITEKDGSPSNYVEVFWLLARNPSSVRINYAGDRDYPCRSHACPRL